MFDDLIKERDSKSDDSMGEVCPECGSKEIGIDTSGQELGFYCAVCGHSWPYKY